jgi:hypothetical protein
MPKRGESANAGTTWEQLRPNTGENGGAGPIGTQDESTNLEWRSRRPVADSGFCSQLQTTRTEILRKSADLDSKVEVY